MEGIAHTAEVTAATLYEAVALGLKHLRSSDWIEGIPEGITVNIAVKNVQVEHSVQMREFKKWLERKGGSSPAELARRKRIREILDLPNT